ncbi:hypothetical protein CBOM_07433 [Ceraceosorus bombacis]|uniref:Uncharacterized protein n=1 Tax=Ceraceosorus bombacis TaxID=401625 RepID=A0A0P1BCG1_9BASI|nr:hypothetical protein CBOM_07433 [Ceraceosorus bombacis]
MITDPSRKDVCMATSARAIPPTRTSRGSSHDHTDSHVLDTNVRISSAATWSVADALTLINFERVLALPQRRARSI